MRLGIRSSTAAVRVACRRRALVASDMLRGRAAGLARKLGEARLMHTMRARWVEADRAHMIEALDQAEHRRRFRGFRHLA